MTRILIVDDEPRVLSALQRALRQRFGDRLQIETNTDALAALGRAREQFFEIVVSDLRMPEMDGISFLTLIAAVQPSSVRVMLTGSSDFETAQRAINDAGIFRYLCKPWSDVELASHIEAALLQSQLAARQREEAAASDPQALERRRLEALEPGITHVEWGPHGEVLMPESIG